MVFHTYGIVTKDLPLDTDIVHARPIDILLNHYEDKVAKVNTSTTKNITRKDEHAIVKVKEKDTIIAKYKPLSNTNQLTPPNIRAGEVIAIYKDSDVSDKYTWDTVGTKDIKLRRNERVILYIGAPGKDNKDELNFNNSYSLLIDGYEGKIQFHTSKDNKEYTTYTFKLDMLKGLFNMLDGKDNSFTLNSREDTWITYANKHIHNIAPKVTFDCNEFNVNAKNSVNFSTSVYNIKASSGMNVSTPTASYSNIVKVANDTITAGIGFMKHQHIVVKHSLAISPPF